MKVTLEFDDRAAANNFMTWWLDGGGEQGLNFDSVGWNLDKGYIRIEGRGETEWEDNENTKDE